MAVKMGVRPTAPKPKLQPRLAIGQPFQAATMPAIPEPVTAIGDRTGKAYFRMGDNPNGPETVQVTPPPGGAPTTTANPMNDSYMANYQQGLYHAPVSMASGGVVTIGNNVLRTPPPGEDPLVGQANFANNMDNMDYYRLGVPAPTATSAAIGQPLSAGQTPALQSSTDEMLNNLKFSQATQDATQNFADEQRKVIMDARTQKRQDAEDAGLVNVGGQYMSPFNAALTRARQSKQISDIVNPNSALDNQLEARKIEEEQQRLKGNVPYQDPNTGAISYMTPIQAELRKAKDEEGLKQQISGVGPGQAKYVDPWTGESRVLTEADAAIQKAKDNARISSAASGQYVNPETGEVTQLTPAQAAIARAQEAKRQSQIVSGVPEGMEKYTDPFTGKQSVLNPADAAVQRLKDNAAIKKEYEATLGPLDKLTTEELVTEISKTEKPGEAANPQSQVFRDALRVQGFSPQAIDILLRQLRDRKTASFVPPTAPPSEGN